MDEIAKTVSEASKKHSVVFTSGGVGPTHDDVTYEAVAKGLKLKLELNKKLVEILSNLFPEEKEAQRLAIVPTPCELVHVHLQSKYFNK